MRLGEISGTAIPFGHFVTLLEGQLGYPLVNDEALLDAKQFSELSKAPAEIQRQPGGSFKLFGARIEGRNI
ncbi:MAG TPA: hypothetical protein VNV86_04375 [Candidatus Acidoferrum sp.]|nr:hypothetical protein [Candidatus Acidoferrum sp.]